MCRARLRKREEKKNERTEAMDHAKRCVKNGTTYSAARLGSAPAATASIKCVVRPVVPRSSGTDDDDEDEDEDEDEEEDACGAGINRIHDPTSTPARENRTMNVGGRLAARACDSMVQSVNELSWPSRAGPCRSPTRGAVSRLLVLAP